MASRIYSIFNGAQPGAAQIAVQATSTGIHSLFQVTFPSTNGAEIIEWGFSGSGSAAPQPGIVELFTSTGGPTTTGFTQYNAADVNKLSFSGNGQASGTTIAMPSSASAWNPAAAGTEVTPTGVRLIDAQELPATAPFIKQFPLERGG